MRRRTSPLIGEGIISKNHCCWKTDGGGAGSFLSLAGWRVWRIVEIEISTAGGDDSSCGCPGLVS